MLRRITKFISIGVTATILYAACAGLLAVGPLARAPAAASLLAYVIAALFSYAGHKFFTFMSAGAHRIEAPRFAVLTLFGVAISYALPTLLTVRLGLPVAVPILLICMFIPAVNFVVLGRWVFSGREPRKAAKL
ncbi:MAG: GtrA family protein [Rhizobiaceae bacterium]